MHCNNGLNNKLVESLVENVVAQETGDLKYLQDSMYDFVKTLKEIILGEYSPEFFNKYVDEALKLHGSNLEEFLKIPKMGLELKEAIQKLDTAIADNEEEYRQHIVELVIKFEKAMQQERDMSVNAVHRFATNDADTPVDIPEFGEIPSLQGYIKELFLSGTGIKATPYQTYLEMSTSGSPDGSYALVVNDPTQSRNKLYYKNNNVWTETEYDPVGQAKEYADLNNPQAKSVPLVDGINSLNASDAQAKLLYMTGSLTQDSVLELPTGVGIWIIRNLTSGGKTVRVKMAGQPDSAAVVFTTANIKLVYSNTSTLSEVAGDKASINSPFFQGEPKTVTAPVGDRGFLLANVAFVDRAVHGSSSVTITSETTNLTEDLAGYSTLLFAGNAPENSVVSFPKKAGKWIVLNATNGSNTLKIITEGQASGEILLNKGQSKLIYSNAAYMRELLGASITPPPPVTDKPPKKLLPRSFVIEETPSNQSPMYMSNDGLKVWSLNASILWESADYGTTWYRAGTFASKPVGLVRQLDNGELIVGVNNTLTGFQEVYRSEGYANGLLDTAITWVLCYAVTSPNTNHTSAWSISTYKNIVLTAEYGPKAGEMWGGATAAEGENARYVRMSLDYGKTWSIIYDLNEHTTTDGVHLHGVCYDPYWQRIWVTYGDKTNATMYSDDLGETWEFAHHGLSTDSPYQNVTIYALPDCILFGTDVAPNGVHRINRSQGKHTATGRYDIEIAYTLNDETVTRTHLCHGMFKAKHFEDSPLLIWFGSESNPAPSIILSTYDGYTFTELYRDSQNQDAGTGMRHVIGITPKNKVIGISSDGRYSGSWTKITIDV